MKLSIEQQKVLKQYLHKVLKYRETHAEFYDHILAALESQSKDKSLRDSVNNIIKEDFGGVEGMCLIERQYQKAIRKEMQEKYLSYITEYLKISLIGITALCSVMIFLLVKQPWFTFPIFLGILFTISLLTKGLTRVSNLVRDLKIGYSFLNTKRSVKDSVFVGLSYIPGLIFLIFIFSSSFKQSPAIWFKNTNPVILTVLILIYTLHTLSYYKVYKNEFLISITNRV